MKFRSTLAAHAALLGVAALAAAAFATVPGARAQELKHYESNNKEFWTHPPDDWFMGDETKEQKGTDVASTGGPPTGLTAAEVAANLGKIKLPKGFHIEAYATGVLSARQMAWGDNGTLFVGSFGVGAVYAITDGGKTVKTILKGLTLPTGIAFKDGALYVAAIDKLYKYDNAEANLDKMPQGKVVYDDMPPYIPHGWKYLTWDKSGWLYVPFGPPCNECMPPTSTAQLRRVDPSTGLAELVAVGIRNSVGGDIDPRTGDYWFSENARDWLGDDKPSDKLNHVTKYGEHFGYPYCHQGDIPDPKFAMGHKCSEFVPPVVKLGAHVAPLGMKFYTGEMFPASYKDNILLTEHGSWNRHKWQGGQIVRIIVDAQGKHAKQEPFATGWIQGGHTYIGRPNDIIMNKDGSIMVADDWAGAIYRISYAK